jgi:hypothetical protein
LAGWFDCQLFGSVWMTNSPSAPRAIHRPQAFMPLDAGLAVKSGDRLKVKIMARPRENLLAWEVSVEGQHSTVVHSTWKARLLAREQLLHRDPAHLPQLSALGRARKSVLALCDGRHSVAELAQIVRQSFPGLFRSSAEASEFIAKVLNKDAE